MGVEVLILLSVVLASANGADVTYTLPNTTVPKSYALTLHIDPGSESYNGTISITFTTTKETNQISLHASKDYLKLTNLNVEDTLVRADQDQDDCKIAAWDNDTEIVTLNCTDKFSKTKDNVVSIRFVGTYSDEPRGLFKGYYEDEVMVATQFEATFARRVFPCFDEPQFKAEFQMTIYHPNGYTVLANTPLDSSNAKDSPTQFVTTPKMSSYLIAFVISKFSTNSTAAAESGEPEFHVYSRADAVNTTDLANKYGPKLISTLESWTGVKYVDMGNAKMDLIALPDKFGGAMENWGLITFSEIDLLDDGKKTTADQKQLIATVMAHELSHQWFGDYVTLDWWSNTWLNEGFANFFENLIPDESGLKLELTKQFVTSVMNQALDADSYPASPLSDKKTDIDTQEKISGKFDGITYNKGASVLRMIQNILGEDNFQKAIRQYLKENKLSNSTPDKLFAKLQEAYTGKDNLTEKLYSFIYKPGYPVVTATLVDETIVQLTQKKFAIMESGDSNDTVWNIPLSYTTSKEKSFNATIKTWLGNNPMNITIGNDSWIILNLKRTGFYRVNYDSTLWNRIITALKGPDMKKIDVLNRAQLVDDVFYLGRVGLVDYDLVFSLTEYLKNETEYYPWVAYFNGIEYLMNLLDSSSVELLEEATLTWLQAAFPNLTHNANDAHVNVLRDTLINEWKCRLGDKKCLAYVNDVYASLSNNSKTDLDNVNERYLVYCNALLINSKPKTVYDDLMDKLNKTKSAYERAEILEALACSVGDLQQAYLNEIIANDSIIAKTEVSKVFNAILKNGESMSVTMFLGDNMEAVIDKYEGYLSISSLVNKIAIEISNDEHLQMVLEKNKDLIENEEEISKTTDSYKELNSNWKKSYATTIKKYLKKLTGNSGTALSPTSIINLLCASIGVILLRNLM